MILKRRRFFFWLIKAYLKRWGKTVLICFVLGVLASILLRFSFPYITSFLSLGEKKIVGVSGIYTLSSLPPAVLSNIGLGLTIVSEEGSIKPGLASSWEITEEGKKYTFHLKKNVFFSSGERLTSRDVNYSFEATAVERPDDYIITYKLKEPYAPFLIRVSQPVVKDNFVGTSEFTVKDVNLNANFVESLILASAKNPKNTIHFKFYDTEDALLNAFMLGEIDIITFKNQDAIFNGKELLLFPNVKYKKEVDYSRLATLFFNTKDEVISDKRIRSALSYALPDTFASGVRNYSPYPPNLWAYTDATFERRQDVSHAKTLLDDIAATSTDSAALSFTIKTKQKFKSSAETIAQEWKKIGVTTKIEIVHTLPDEFQIYLDEFQVSKDPDQYSLWHSNQKNNITKYNNQRIDKLLEDGRKAQDLQTRKEIYADFQKYFFADAPAAFLFFPYEYTITRK